MLQPSIKQRVRNSFDRAAVTYDSAAVVQRRVCDRLLDELQIPHTPQRIVDAGCGSGYGARQLRSRWPDTHITKLKDWRQSWHDDKGRETGLFQYCTHIQFCQGLRFLYFI